MMKLTFLKYGLIQLLFLVIPLATLITGMLYLRNGGMFFIRMVDPEYGYLLNGLLLAHGKFDIQFITNPGIPVHIIVAIVLRVVHLFRPGLPLFDDVMMNPEFYIRAVIYTIDIMSAFALFLLGFFAYRYTRNIVIAFFLQLMSLTNLLSLEVFGRMIPESVMMFMVCGWLIVILSIIYHKGKEINYHRYSAIFGLLFALGISDKLTFLPFFLIPLVLLNGWKYKLYYTGYFVFFFIIVAFPVTLNFNFFKDWVTGILTHTGPYGSGGSGIIDVQLFKHHFRLLRDNNHILILSVIGLFLASMLSLILRKRKIDRHLIYMNLGIITVVVLQFMIASKHFAYHYMIPSILLTTFIIFLTFKTGHAIFPHVKEAYINSIIAFTGLILILIIIPRINAQLLEIKSIMAKKNSGYHQLAVGMQKLPKIISPAYYGGSSLEYGLSYGILVSGKYGGLLSANVNKYYPKTYMHFSWSRLFYEGNKEIKPSAFIQPDVTYTLYIGEYSPGRLKGIIKDIQSDMPGYEANVIPVNSVTESAEALYQITFKQVEDLPAKAP